MRRTRVLAVAALAAALGLVSMTALAATSVKPYVKAVGSDYAVTALFSVDDRVPLVGDPSKRYRMVGIPDGLGAHPNGDGTSTLYMNHELPQSTLSEPVVGSSWKQRGAFVSLWILDENGNPIAGKRAFDHVYLENTYVGPAATTANGTRAFSRFCSGSLAGPPHGFDRWIYFANEEESRMDRTFDGKGGLPVAIVDGNAYALPRLGHASWENVLVQPNHGTQTVIIGLEDGPAALPKDVENSQVYMYVGTKDRRAGTGVLRRNGLDNGELYVLAPKDPAFGSEREFRSGTIEVEWKLIPNARELNNDQLEAVSDAVGALRFARPEDGAFNKLNRNEFFFVTTGGAKGDNELGRLYSLRLHPGNVTKGGTLEILYNADEIVRAGGDIAISPDNIDTSREYLMINEDGTSESRPVMARKGRDGSVWRFELDRHGLDVSTAKRIAELDPPGRDGVPVGPGIWETSGIIDASELFGRNTWLSDVQAHSPTAAPGDPTRTITVEDGQLFLLRPSR